jgi:phosphoribosyl 1,2-cyclic phosphate phosphodiesterase
MLQSGDVHILIDAGPDFRQQMLTHHFTRLDAILLTHEHNDHISGLDDVRPLNFRQRNVMPLYGMPRVLDAVRRRFDYVFDTSYPGLPKLMLKELFAGKTEIEGIPVQVIEVMHGDLPILGFRIGDFAYITDAKRIPEQQVAHLQNLDVLILNALHHKVHFSHLNLQEAMELIELLAPRQAYLTHLSHDMGLQQDLEAELPPRVRLAFDGLQLKTRI